MKTPKSLSNNLSNYKILIIQVKSIKQKLHSKKLDRIGCVFDLTRNNKEGLNLIAKNYYHLILINFNPPDTNALSLATKIRIGGSKNSATPIVACVNSVSPEIEVQCLNSGFSAVISYPLSKEKLVRLIEKYAVKNLVKNSAGKFQHEFINQNHKKIRVKYRHENIFDTEGKPTTSFLKAQNVNGRLIRLLGKNKQPASRLQIDAIKMENIAQQQKIKELQILGGTIAHELRNPLGAITLQYDLIEIALTSLVKELLENNKSFYNEKLAKYFAQAIESITKG